MFWTVDILVMKMYPVFIVKLLNKFKFYLQTTIYTHSLIFIFENSLMIDNQKVTFFCFIYVSSS